MIKKCKVVIEIDIEFLGFYIGCNLEYIKNYFLKELIIIDEEEKDNEVIQLPKKQNFLDRITPSTTSIYLIHVYFHRR